MTMGVRSILRRVRDASIRCFHRMMQRWLLAALERTVRSGRTPDARFLTRLVRSWGNEAWSADAPLLLALLEWLPRSQGAVLECGSGLSSLVLATAIVPSRRLISIEHDPAWASLVRAAMSRKLLARAELVIAPLRNYGYFEWYAIDSLELPGHIGFVMCDGPPGSTYGGRYGLGPLLRDRLSPGCIVLLDDTQRPEERAIMNRWCEELPATIVHEGPTYSVLKVGEARALAT